MKTQLMQFSLIRAARQPILRRVLANGALADMQRGLAILDRTLGRQHPRYLRADIAYLRLLERTEAHAEAARLKTTAEQELRILSRPVLRLYHQCCSVPLKSS